MGGAVAVQFAHDHPRRTLGLIYRDGVSTPAWKDRSGIIPTLLSPVLPDVAPMVDMISAVVFDLPDLAIGRLYSTVRAVLPDMRQNIRTLGQTMPVGSMLMSLDQRSQVRTWWPKRSPSSTSGDASTASRPGTRRSSSPPSRGHPCVWVPGGHSWMLARPQGQADILTHLARGQEFIGRVVNRWRQLTRTRVTRYAPSTECGAVAQARHRRGRAPGRRRAVIDQLLHPLLTLSGWEAYVLVGLLVFAEAAVMLGFVFPGETAAILGGVLASKGGVTLAGITATVIVCAIVGDSVGYLVGESGVASS